MDEAVAQVALGGSEICCEGFAVARLRVSVGLLAGREGMICSLKRYGSLTLWVEGNHSSFGVKLSLSIGSHGKCEGNRAGASDLGHLHRR